MVQAAAGLSEMGKGVMVEAVSVILILPQEVMTELPVTEAETVALEAEELVVSTLQGPAEDIPVVVGEIAAAMLAEEELLTLAVHNL
jgi:hypothetical protein